MGIFGKQHRYCPNCGAHLYDDRIETHHAMSMMCGDACREEWSMKYARRILGHSAPEDEDAPQKVQTARGESGG